MMCRHRTKSETAALFAHLPLDGSSPLAAAAVANAHVGRARRQPEVVIAALEPLRRLSQCDRVCEPAVVCWPDLLAGP
jgi:hypothetical protein